MLKLVFTRSLIYFLSIVTAILLWNSLFRHQICQNSTSEHDERLIGPLTADDSTVINILRSNYLEKPSLKPYNLSKNLFYKDSKNKYSWPFIYYYTNKIFGDYPNGFFVEAGALDGEYLSNTLWLEQELNWTGLLIEAEPYNYKELMFKNRKSWTSNTCISSELYPKQTVFVSRRISKYLLPYNNWVYRGASHELGYSNESALERFFMGSSSSYVSVQCFPLLSYLLALNRTKIDFLSLDIQGSEIDVLKAFPFDRIDVRLLSIEHNNPPFFDPSFVQFFKDRGYENIGCGGEPDYIFIKKEYYQNVDFEKRFECRIL